MTATYKAPELEDCGYSTAKVQAEETALGEFAVNHGHTNAYGNRRAVSTLSGPGGFPSLVVSGHRTGNALDAYWTAFAELMTPARFHDVMIEVHAAGERDGREELQARLRELLGVDE